MRRSERLLGKFKKKNCLKAIPGNQGKFHEAETQEPSPEAYNAIITDQLQQSLAGTLLSFKNTGINISSNIATELLMHNIMEVAPGTESKFSVPEQNNLTEQFCIGTDFVESKVNLLAKKHVKCEIVDLTKSPSLENSHKAKMLAKTIPVNKELPAKKENKRKRKTTATNLKRKGKMTLRETKKIRLEEFNSKTLPSSENFQETTFFTPNLSTYDNPVKDLNIPPILRIQPVENGGPFYDNAIDPRLLHLNSVQESFLPRVYPPHFTQQLPPETAANLSSQLHNFHPWPASNEYAYYYPTPDFTQLFDFPSTSTTPLSDTMLDLFGSDDIREVPKMEKPLYRLSLLHLQTLALILNLSVDYVRNLIEKILTLGPDLLQKIALAFNIPQTNAKPFHDTLTPDTSSIVDPSQSPRTLHRYSSQRM